VLLDSFSILKRRRGQLLPSKSDETELKPTAATGGTTTAKGSMATCGTMMVTGGSTAMSSTTTRQNEGDDGRHDNTAVSPYYSKFQLRIRNEPAAAHYGANAGLKNSNVNCYSNAIFQCIASCICYSGFSPSEKHP